MAIASTVANGGQLYAQGKGSTYEWTYDEIGQCILSHATTS